MEKLLYLVTTEKFLIMLKLLFEKLKEDKVTCVSMEKTNALTEVKELKTFKINLKLSLPSLVSSVHVWESI